MDYYFELMRGMGVNALRVPLAVDNVLTDPKPSTSAWRDTMAAKMSSSLAVLDQLVQKAADANILVLMDMHRLVGQSARAARVCMCACHSVMPQRATC